MEQQNKLDTILRAINEETERHEKEIIKEASMQVEAELDKARENAKRDSERFEKQQIDKINEQTSRKITENEIDLRREVFKRRMEIMDEVFSQSSDEIIKFTQSDKYLELLIASAKKIASVMHNDCHLIHLCSRDLPLASKITGYLGNSIGVITDDEIKLGGIKAFSKSGSVMIDDTLDTRLEAEKDWFMKNSRLEIS